MKKQEKQSKAIENSDLTLKGKSDHVTAVCGITLMSRGDEITDSDDDSFFLFSYPENDFDDTKNESQTLNNENQQEEKPSGLRPHLRLIND